MKKILLLAIIPFVVGWNYHFKPKPVYSPISEKSILTTNTLSVYEILYGGAATNIATLNANGLKAQSGNNNYWTYDNVGIKHNNTNVLYRFGPGFYALNSPNGFPFKVLSDAASDSDIVNYRTATNLIAQAINGITVTQTFLDASSNIRTNIFINGILTSGYTE